MFRGRFIHTIDAKGRLSIPARFRETLIERHAGRLILTNDLLDKCIVAYTPAGWEELEAKIQKASSMDEGVKAFSRHFFSSAEDCTIDSQGRILLSPRLREYAGLTKEALVAGVAHHKIEIWNPALWEQTMAAIDPRAITKRIAELGI